jgi:FkbM family methyltransferase
MLTDPRIRFFLAQLRVLKSNLLKESSAPRVRLSRSNGIFRVHVGEEAIWFVSLDRWSFYSDGLDARAKRICTRYGISQLIPDFFGKTIVDIGANVGEFSVFAARGGAKVYSVEPDRINLIALMENTRGLDCDISALALWNEDGPLKFYSSIAGADSSAIQPERVDSEMEVHALRLDRLMQEKGVGEIFLIKADAEGAEPEVLTGALETLKRTRFVAIDCGPERYGKSTAVECTAILQSAGHEVSLVPGSLGVLFSRNQSL